jgi:hypothetical protein
VDFEIPFLCLSVYIYIVTCIARQVVERQEIPNEEVAINSQRACRNERTARQETMKANPEKMEPIGRAIAILEQMIAMTKTNKEKIAATDLKGNPEEMECELEHQEAPKEDAVVKPVEGQNRRHRGRKQIARRRGEPKELNRGICGSRKKLAAACRKVSRRATVAWRKRNILRKSWTQRNCGLRKEVAAAGIKVTRRPGVARRKRNFVREDSTRGNSE